MRYRNAIKLVPVCAAFSFLVYTTRGVINEDRETKCVSMALTQQNISAECTTEQVPEEKPEEKTEPGEPHARIYLDPADEEILLKISMSEAGGESIEGKALVMLTVLNRVHSSDFPDTIYEVVFQETQYSPVSDGRYFTAIPDSDCKEALEMVESGWDESMGAMYFENSGSESWHSKHLEYFFQCGNHKFYR